MMWLIRPAHPGTQTQTPGLSYQSDISQSTQHRRRASVVAGSAHRRFDPAPPPPPSGCTGSLRLSGCAAMDPQTKQQRWRSPQRSLNCSNSLRSERCPRPGRLRVRARSARPRNLARHLGVVRYDRQLRLLVVRDTERAARVSLTC